MCILNYFIAVGTYKAQKRAASGQPQDTKPSDVRMI